MTRPAAVLVTLVLAAGCSSGTTGASAPSVTPAPQPTVTVSPCAKVPAKGFAWPAPMPKDLPQPPGATLVGVTTTPQGLTIARIRTYDSLQAAVLFVIRAVQQAGYTLGRGDAEPAEADAPFGKGNLRGVYKMLGTGACVTDWLVATTIATPTDTSPLLPTPSHGPSSHPLPFG